MCQCSCLQHMSEILQVEFQSEEQKEQTASRCPVSGNVLFQCL